ncbi:kelch domain-containing protein 7A [Trichomycterus rosablanca]|uniref:kelch domain-containing protein 7A n=1 Tax=Trichomycterus rosablanca TaxID=2290929 RepID=UPI002F3512E3
MSLDLQSEMTIADLLGERVDMKLLGKLTLSVAAVVFISWVFRFYSSRAQARKRANNGISLLSPANKESNGGSWSRQSTLDSEPESLDESNTTPDGDKSEDLLSATVVNYAEKKENLCEPVDIAETKDFLTTMEDNSAVVECTTAYVCGDVVKDYRSTMEDFMVSAVTNPADEVRTVDNFCGKSMDKANVNVNDCKTGLTLLIPTSSDNGTASPTGRRSPCQLKMLDSGVEIGRELRQDLDHLGSFSSFQSKAEIKVEDADLVIEGPGNRSTGVRGRIYDYYVETTSRSVLDISPTLSSPRPVFGTYDYSPSTPDPPRTPSPRPSCLIIRDLDSTLESDRSPRSPVKSVGFRPCLIRKDSYLAAAEDSELQLPSSSPATSPRSRSPAFPNEVPPSYESYKQIQEPQVETVARAKFLHFPVDSIVSSELESITSKLDLGNCLEALMLAKKHEHGSLEQAALKVMSDNYLQVLRDPGLYGRLKAGEREQIQRLRRKGRRCLMVADMESSEWSRCQTQSSALRPSNGLYYYDDYKDSWHLQSQIPPEVFSNGCAICTMDNYLFVAVGFQRTVPSKKVFCYNPMTSIWSEICPMNDARPHCKLVALQDHVYAIGGECLSTVERYDPRTNRWTYVAPLPNDTFAVAHRATACNGELFVSGGTLKYTLLRYNPKTDQWRRNLLLGTRERTAEMVSERSFLYRFDVSPLGISVYRYHVVAKLWYQCCSKQMPNCPAFKCVATDGMIYCVSRQFTMRFLADDVSPGFVAEDLEVLSAAKGILFPFVLALPDKSSPQTSV